MSTLNSSIKDNFSNGKVGNFLIEHITADANLSFVTAYFTIYAYEKLKPQLDNVKSLRLLFGEPKFIKSVASTPNAKNFEIVDDNLVIPVENRLQQKVLAKQCGNWIREKVEIKSMVRPDFLHGKLYHIQKPNGVEDAVTGSSNFTVNGLGLGSSPNIELNLVVNDRRDLNDLKQWFNTLWNNEMPDVEVEDVKDQVLKYIELLHRDNSPEFVYYKTLFHIFEQYLKDEDVSGLSDIKANLYDSQIWKELFTFQQHGVRGAINKILKYNGCIIADSVGLGKTYEALAVIKYFEERNKDVLVLCPKKLRENWTVYLRNDELNPFTRDKFSYDVLSHTDLSRETGKSGDINIATIKWYNYDLVVIDESHNFRNNKKGKKDEEGNTIRKSRYERLMQDIICSGKKTKVLLLSATPVNNNLKDLLNQLLYITANDEKAFAAPDSLGIDNIKDLLQLAQTQFTKWATNKIQQDKTTSNLLNNLDAGFFKLLDALTIARSRKHITKYYKSEMERIGGFPIHEPVLSIYPEIDTEHKFLPYDKLNDKISKYALAHFTPSKYVLPQHKQYYQDLMMKKSGLASSNRSFNDQEKRESYLIGMMKVNFMKRLESSIYSFDATLQRTIDKIDNLIQRIDQFEKYKNENIEIDIDEIDTADLEDEELKAAFEVGEKFPIKLNHINLIDWKAAMQDDKDQLFELQLRSEDVLKNKRDAKLKELKALIKKKVNNPTITKTGTENKKVIVFTAFADTQNICTTIWNNGLQTN